MQEADKELLIRYFYGIGSPWEKRRAQELLQTPEAEEFFYGLTLKEWDKPVQENDSTKDTHTRWKEKVHARIHTMERSPKKNSPIMRLLKLRYAAIFAGFILLAGASWLILNKSATNSDQLAQQEDILPGQNKAMLTLADGSTISLSEAESGTIAMQEGIQIEKTKEGDILYNVTDPQQEPRLAMNTITTPKGGQYRITLPDGSKVWLNAASSISYPVHFAANERRVTMTGEVYFEIAKLKQADRKDNVPFFVETDKQEIQVLGTHFNVNAYSDESAVKTTLVEGSVRINADNGQSALLRPGQQAVLAQDMQVMDADIQQQLAWKNGDFIFRGETLESLLRQVARWYDVEVEYPSHLGQLRFNGMVSRSQPLSTIVAMIQSTKKAKVTLKERRFIVTD